MKIIHELFRSHERLNNCPIKAYVYRMFLSFSTPDVARVVIKTGRDYKYLRSNNFNDLVSSEGYRTNAR